MFSINRSHYSAAGSLLVWRRHKTQNILYLDCIRTGLIVSLYEISFSDNAEFTLSPSHLELRDNKNTVRFCMNGKNGTVISGHGCLTLHSADRGNGYNASYIVSSGEYIKICEYAIGGFNYFKAARGEVIPEGKKKVGEVSYDSIDIHINPDENGDFEFFIEHTTSDIPTMPLISFENLTSKLSEDFEKFASKLECRTEHDREHAYVLWSNTVSKTENYPDGGIVMSKSGMANIWSWDNCFNALDLAKCDPETALIQFMIPYLHLDECGRAPDSVAPEKRIGKEFVKPPIQGWIYRRMMERNEFFKQRDVLAKVYFPMKRNTDWWLNFRGETPSYHHGNDSGADNSTSFDAGIHIETPELVAFLSVQCRLIADIAEQLGMATDKQTYKRLSDELCEKANRNYFDGRLFVRDGVTGQPHYSASLLPLRMIVLEDRLSDEIRNYIIENIRDNFICPHGIASEAHNSPAFKEDGYWRGAAWGPDQVFFALSLRALGENELADRIAVGYKSALEANGFSENHAPISGNGQRCRAYTWSANAYNII